MVAPRRCRRTFLKTHLTPRDLALTLAVVAVWGFAFVPIKVALAEVPPFTLAGLRFFLAALPMVFFGRVSCRRCRCSRSVSRSKAAPTRFGSSPR